MTRLELLAPARDSDTALAAIRHGADAVYIGAPAFGARAAAANSIDDIRRVVEAARPFGVRVYVTLNTIIYNDELDEARRLVEDLWRIGVDALIVQDMALLELDIPPIDLHASTQTDARTPQKMRRLADAGFSQIVIPREFSLEEIRRVHAALPDTRLEAFVHGALCVSFSGDCHAGAMLNGRSANRGECPQVCRLRFTLTDGRGRPLDRLPDGGSPTRHWLSTADLNRLDSLGEMADAGVTSFKIEGRLKSADYVKNVTLAYSRALDNLVKASGGKYARTSFGNVEAAFEPDVARSFNRGFTPYFLTRRDAVGITSWQTPKWVGRPVATLVTATPDRLRVKARETINNGDGLGYFAPDGTFTGFRVNRAVGPWLYPAPGSAVPSESGITLYRNSDMAWDAVLARDDSARRTIALEMRLRPLPDGRIALDASDERGCRITVVSDDRFVDTARSPQEARRREILDRLGDTVYRLAKASDLCGDIFIPPKALAALRRKAVEALDSDWTILRQRPLRRPSKLTPETFAGLTTSYHDNVANRLAAKFYRDHGAKIGQYAAETVRPEGDIRVMTTRYCLRRELGCCLKTRNAAWLPPDLRLKAPIGTLRLHFDCEKCNMNIILPEKP